MQQQPQPLNPMQVQYKTSIECLMLNRKQQDSSESLHRQIILVPPRDLTPPSKTNCLKGGLILILDVCKRILLCLYLLPNTHVPVAC